MRELGASRIVAGVAVVLVLAGLYGLADLGHMVTLGAGTVPAQPRSLTVAAVTRVCPAPGASSAAGSGIALMAAPPGTGHAAPGSAVLSRLSAATTAPLLDVTQPGSPRSAPVTIDRTTAPAAGTQQASAGSIAATPVRGGVVLQARGAMSQGLEVEQTAAGNLPTAACGAPGTDFWFAGPGQRTVARIQLYLMNPSGQAADADVDIFTDAGPLQETTDTGITVPPHGMVVQSLAAALHGSRAITLHVRTSVGQVAAAVQEASGPGPGAWLPAAAAPASSLVIPGLSGTNGARDLYVAVPGVKDAVVQLTAVTSRGSYEPTGATGIDIPGGSVVDIALPSLSGIPAALKLKSSAPVTASAVLPGGAAGAPGTFTAAAAALTQRGVLADTLNGAGRSSSLVLSAPGRAARVSVAEIAAGGAGAQRTQVVPVSAAHSVVLPLTGVPGKPANVPFAVVITPLAGSGPVYAGRVIMANGTLQSMLPVASALTFVPLPPVRGATITTGS